LPSGRAAASSVVVGNSVYLLSGEGPQRSARATIAATSALTTFSSFTAAQPEISRVMAVPIFTPGSVYLIGGDDGSLSVTGPRPAVASVDADGTLSPFSYSPSGALKQARRGPAAFVAGGWAYVAGGLSPGGVALGSIERAAIGRTDGHSLDDFQTVASIFVTARVLPTIAVVGDQVYVVGGTAADGAPIKTVERATLDANGNLSSFVIVPNTTLNLGRSGHSSALVGGSLWVLGGLQTIASGDVERTFPGTAGVPSPFMLATGFGLPAARDRQSATFLGGALAVLGGLGGMPRAVLGDVVAATISPSNGQLQPFAPLLDVQLQEPRQGHVSFVLGNWVYVVGGQGSINFPGVERAMLR
jgi:hypothetical protein